MGLLDYPVLQAADVALFKGEAVPVGEDQVQHLELCRDIVEKFNARFGATLPMPKVLLSPAARVMGLDGQSKMSKSLNNYISLIEESEALWKKLAPAVTDPARKRRTDPGNPDVCNVFSYHQLFSSPEDMAQVRQGCTSAGIGCIDCKKILYNNMEKVIGPIRERAKELFAKPDYIAKVLREGAEKVRPIAKATMREVYEKVGFTYSL
jgi:tryptophanyl-tRNA synthetase